MSRTEKIRARPFTSEELEVLVNEVLAQYPRLFGGPNVVLKVHQRKAVWRAIAAKVRALGVSNRRRTHCHKRWDDISRLAKQVAEMTLGMVPRTGRLARRTMTPLMGRILAVTNPDLDARLKGHQQQDIEESQDTTVEHDPETSGGEGSTTAPAETSETEPSDTEHTSASEGDRSMQEDSVAETQSTTSSDASGDAAMLAGTGDGESAAASDTQQPVPSLPSTSSGAGRIRVTKRGRVTFTPGTAAPAPVPPAALSAECVELLRQLCVGQTALLNAFSAHENKLGQVIAFMEAIHSDVGGLHRTVQALSSTVTSALQQAPAPIAAQVPVTTTHSVATSDDSDHCAPASPRRYNTRSTHQSETKHSRPQTPSPKKSRAHKKSTDKGKSQKSKARRSLWQTSGSHAAEASPEMDSPMPTEDVWNVMDTPGESTGTQAPTTSTPNLSPSRQVEESPVVSSPVIEAEEGSVVTSPMIMAKDVPVVTTSVIRAKEVPVVTTPVNQVKEGSVVTTPVIEAEEGSVVTTPGKKGQEGTVDTTPGGSGKVGTVGGTASREGKVVQRRSQPKRSAGSSTSPEGVPVSAPDVGQLVCVPVVSPQLPINPKTGKPFHIPKKWKGTPPTSPTHTVSGVCMTPPPRATMPPGPHSPPPCRASVITTSHGPLEPKSSGPAVHKTQPGPSPRDSQE